MILNAIQKELNTIREEKLYRSLPNIELTDSPNHVLLDRKKVLNACSNNYLGLTHNREISRVMNETAKQYGNGSGASRLVSGNHQQYIEAEKALLSYFDLSGEYASIIVGNGYCCNVGLLSALGSISNTEFFMDKLCHASLIDGSELAHAKRKRYRHNDVSHLEKLLQQSEAENKIIVTDGIFSMDGDIAPLAELVALKKKHNAFLIVDDAHGVGVLGKNGMGIAEELGIAIEEIDCLVGTFGKAFGLYGAFAVAKKEVIDFLVNRARSVIFSTGLPPMILSSITKSLEIVSGMQKERDYLQEQSIFVRKSLQERDFDVPDGITPIIPVIIGRNEDALQLAQKCRDKNVFISAIRPPAVPKNTARLRLTLSSSFTKTEINEILSALKNP